MINGFADNETEKVYNGERSRRLPVNIQEPARKKLRMLNNVASPEELRKPPGNRFEDLEGRNGFYSIRVNRQWRITFSWGNSGAENVRIEDYH